MGWFKQIKRLPCLFPILLFCLQRSAFIAFQLFLIMVMGNAFSFPSPPTAANCTNKTKNIISTCLDLERTWTILKVTINKKRGREWKRI